MEDNQNVDNCVNNLEELTNKTQTTKKQKTLKIVSITLNTIFYIFIFMLLIFSITQITGSEPDKVKNIFGLGYETVASNSMKPDPNGLNVVDESRAVFKKDSFTNKDVIWVSTLNNKEKKKLKVGDIITFWDTISEPPAGVEYSNGFLNTHRIVEIIYTPSGEVSSYITQGDSYFGTPYEYGVYEGETGQLVNERHAQNVSLDSIRAKYIGKWTNAGSFIRWISDPSKGFIVVIILPTILFLLFEMFMVIKNIMAIKTQKMAVSASEEKEQLRLELEAEKEKMKQELLEQLRKEALEEAKKQEESKEEKEE